MRLRQTLIAALLIAAPLVAAGPALAANQPDSVAVGRKDIKATRGFSSSLGIFVTAPAEWGRLTYTSLAGAWGGPKYRPSKNPNIEDTARLDWSVAFSKKHKSLQKLARAANGAGWPEVAATKLKMKHTIEGHRVGSLPAFAAIEGEAFPGARHEATVAIDLSRHLTALVTFLIIDPAADDTGAAGTVSIDGKPASQWNREQIQASIADLFVEGNLPPKRVTAERAGSAVKGKVTDSFRQPLGEAKVLLQKQAGHRWKTVRKGATSAKGTYKLRPRGAGRYRVVTQVGGSSVHSKPVSAR
jgi:hypothetical protein